MGDLHLAESWQATGPRGAPGLDIQEPNLRDGFLDLSRDPPSSTCFCPISYDHQAPLPKPFTLWLYGRLCEQLLPFPDIFPWVSMWTAFPTFHTRRY